MMVGRVKRFWRNAFNILLIGGTILVSSLAVDAVRSNPFIEWLPETNQFRYRIATGVIWLCMLMWTYHRRRFFVPVRQLSQTGERPSRCLAFFVSLPSGVAIPAKENFDFPLTLERGGESAVIQGENIEDDIETLNAFKGFSWQQILRGLQPHADKVKHIVLIGSPETEAYLDRVGIWLKRYLEKDVEIRSAPRAVSFESFEDLARLTETVIDRLRKETPYSERDIMIDVTGGQKTTSIIGAMATLNKRVMFQYVSTTPPSFFVKTYDLEMEYGRDEM